MSAELKIIARLQDDASRGIHALRGEVEGLGGSGAIAAKGLQSVQAVGVMVAAAVTVAAVAVAAFVKSSIDAGIKFESAFAGVVKTVDGVVDAGGNLTAFGQQLRDDFRQLALEIPVPVNELAKIGELGGQLGVAGEDLIEFTDLIAKLGVTTNLSTESAAMSFAQFGNIMQSSQEDLTRFGSAVVWLGNNFATTEADIVEFATRIAGAGAIAGMTEADLAGIAAAFSSVGVQAEAGGTAVQKVLIDMNTAVVTGGPQLEKYARAAGMSAEQFVAAWRSNPGQAFARFVEGLGLAGDEAVLILEDLGMADARLVRGFLSVAQAGDLLSRAISGSNDAFDENMALAREAALRFQTTESQMQLFKNVINDVKIGLYDALRPALVAVLSSMTLFITSIAPQVRAFFAAIGEATGQFVTALQNGASPLTAFVNALFNLGESLGVPADQLASLRGLVGGFLTAVGSVAGPIMAAITSFVSWKDVLLALGIAVASVVIPAILSIVSAVAPIVLAFGTLVLAIAAVRTAFETNFLGIQTLALNLWGALKAALEGIKALLSGDTAAAMTLFRQAWETGWTAVVGFVRNAGTMIGQALAGLWQSVVTWFQGVDWAGLGRGLVEKLLGGMAVLGQARADLWTWILTALTNFINSVNWGQIGYTMVDLLGKGIVGAVGVIAVAMAAIVTFIWNFITKTDWIGLGRDLVGAILNGLDSFAAGAAAKLGEWYRAIADWVAKTDWEGIGQKIVDFVASAMAAGAAAIGNQLGGWYAAIADWAKSANWMEIGASIVNYVLDGLAEFASKAAEAVGNWNKAVRQAIDNIDWFQLGYDIASAIVKGLKDINDLISDTVSGWLGQFQSVTAGMSWKDISLLIIDAVVLGLLTFINWVAEIASNWYSAISGALGQYTAAFADLGKNLVSGVISGIVSMAGAIGDAISGIIAGALAAARGQNEVKSPSRLWARELGEPLTEGIALGIVNAAGTVINAISQVAKQTETAGIKAFSEAVESIAALTSDALRATGLLSGFNFDAAVRGWHLRDQIVTFRNIIRTMVREFAEAAGEFGAMSESVGAFADAAGSVIGLVEDGLAAVVMLSRIDFGEVVGGWHLRDQIVTFRNIIRTMVREFAEAAGEFGAMSESVEAFADAAGSVIGLVEDGLAAVAALSAADFGSIVNGWHLRDQIVTFRNIIRTMVREFAEAAGEFGAMSESVEAFADAAGSVIGLVEPAFEAFELLVSFSPVADLQARAATFAGQLMTLLTTVAGAFAKASEEARQALTMAAEFAGHTGDILGVVDPGINALVALAAYAAAADIEERARQFTADLVATMVILTTGLTQSALAAGDSLERGSAMAEALGALIGIIQPGIDGLTALAAYTAAADVKAKAAQFTSDLTAAASVLVAGLMAAASALGGAAVEAAKRFATDALAIIDSVKAALESLGAIGTLPRPDIGPALAYMAESGMQIRQAFNEQGVIGDAVAYAAAFRANLEQLVTEVRLAVTQIAMLAGTGTSGPVTAALAAIAAALLNTADLFAGAGRVLAETLIAAMVEGIRQGTAAVSMAVISLMSTALNSATGVAGGFGSVGQTAIGAIVGVLASGRTLLGNSGAMLGESVVSGFTRAMAAGQAGIMRSVSGAMGAAVNAARATLQIASPSAVFGGLADNTVAGYVNGLTKGSAQVWGAVDRMMQGAVDRASGSTLSVGGYAPAGMGGVQPAFASGGSSMVPGGDVNVTINIDGGNHSLADIRRQVEQAVGDAMRQQGRRADAMVRNR